MSLDYATVRRDFEYLESIAELDDQVGLDAARLTLMENPTKAQAAKMYLSGILSWFSQHGSDEAPHLAEVYL